MTATVSTQISRGGQMRHASVKRIIFYYYSLGNVFIKKKFFKNDFFLNYKNTREKISFILVCPSLTALSYKQEQASIIILFMSIAMLLLSFIYISYARNGVNQSLHIHAHANENTQIRARRKRCFYVA